MGKILGIMACGVVIANTKTADALPVLLATVSNDVHPYADDIIETWAMGDVFQYSVQNEDGYFRARLFEDTRVSVRVNDAPITLNESITAADDPDFALVAQFLTDGISFAENVFQDVMVLRMLGGENILDVHVPRISEYDLFGYTIERIDRDLTFSMQSPGRDLNGDGLWTDFHIGGVYEFWGTPTPEPATLMLLALGSLAVLRRRR
jgi:hypothetical protein